MFSGPQIHLALNHFPVVGSVFTCLFLALYFLRPSAIWLRNAGLSLAILSALISIPAYLSGDPAEEVVEDKPGVTEPLIHEHEEAAEAGFVAILMGGGLALASLFLIRKSHRFAKAGVFVTFITFIVSAVLMANAAHLGGMIRHDELRSGESAPSGGEADQDDD